MPTSVLKFTGRAARICKRDLGIFAPALQKASDPIQQLFLDKIKEFRSKSSSGKPVEMSPDLKKELEQDRTRIYKQFNVKPGEDLSKFPSMSFPEPAIEKPYILEEKN